MKRLILILINAVTIIRWIVAFGSETNVAWTYRIQSDGSAILDYYAVPQSTRGGLVIPASISGHPVKGIGNYAFYGCAGLTSVMIPEGVMTIGDHAFDYCSKLESVTIPSSVTSIGAYAFGNCSELTSLQLPEGLVSIGMYAFYDCSKLTELRIFGNVTSIGSCAFYGCASLGVVDVAEANQKYISVNGILYDKEFSELIWCSCKTEGAVTVQATVTNICSCAFRGCSEVTSVLMPESVTTIGNSAFAYCSGLTSMVIPVDVLSIEASVFCGCSGLTSIMIPDGVRSIGCNAFYGCRGLTSVTIPESVLSIGEGAFSGCSGLTNMTLPFVGSQRGDHDSSDGFFGYIFGTSVYSGAKAARWMYDGKTYQLPATLRSVIITDEISIGNGAFYDCEMLTSVTVYGGVTNIGDHAFSGCNELAFLRIPESVKTIGNSAFCCCTGLTSVTIPVGVTSIGVGAFSACSGLSSVCISDIAAWCGIKFGDNPLMYAHKLIINDAEVKDLQIPEGVTRIGESAFCGCSGLMSVTIPSTTESIGDHAFRGCKNLREVTLSEGLTHIEDTAFYDCEVLTSVTMPSSVRSVGDYAFYGCKGLELMTLSEGVTNIGTYAFCKCSGLKSVALPSSVASVGKFAFLYCRGLREINVSDSNVRYYSVDGIFFDGHKLIQCPAGFCGSIVIPSDVTGIEDYAFESCEGLTSVTIPEGVTNVGERVFSGCSGLISVQIPDNVISIGTSAFSGCSGLTFMQIPDSVISIGTSAFSGCSGLASIQIPDSVISIGASAFSGCSGLASISLPFVGSQRGNSGSYDSFFCYIFGTDPYPGAMAAVQNLAVHYATYYIPISLKSVVITDETKIGDSAFCNCSGLISVTLPEGVTSIGYNAFYGCSGLMSMMIPQGVKNIEDLTFGCCGLTSVAIPSSVESIGRHAFMRCSTLTSITIPKNVRSIGVYAFSDCSGLEVVYVEKGDMERVMGLYSWPSTVKIIEINPPIVDGDDDAVVSGNPTTGFVVKPSEGKMAVEVTIPQGVDAAKVTVEVSPKVASVKPNGAKVKIVSGGADITEFLDVPAADGNGVVDLTKATIKEEIVKEVMDVEKGAEIKLDAVNPSLTTPNTRVGLFYQLREGTTLEGMSNGDSTIGDGNPWKPEIKVKGGNSAFYSIGVGKGE